MQFAEKPGPRVLVYAVLQPRQARMSPGPERDPVDNGCLGGRWRLTLTASRGDVGARSLNIELQAALNPAGDRKVERFGWTFAPGDKVIARVGTARERTLDGWDRQRDVYEAAILPLRDGLVIVREPRKIADIGLLRRN